jgi:hypothetical protein
MMYPHSCKKNKYQFQAICTLSYAKMVCVDLNMYIFKSQFLSDSIIFFVYP